MLGPLLSFLMAMVIETNSKFFSILKCTGNRGSLNSFPKDSAAAAKSLQSCPTLCDPRDSSPPGFSFPGIPRQEYWSGLPFPSSVHENEK